MASVPSGLNLTPTKNNNNNKKEYPLCEGDNTNVLPPGIGSTANVFCI
jgi:hypothetical protein